MSNSIIAGCGFHHVAMKVANFDQVVAFYTEGLGFSVKKQWPGAIMLDAGDGVCLEIFPDGRFETVDNSYVHVAFKVDDVDAALARAAAYGAKITIPPQGRRHRQRSGLPRAHCLLRGPLGRDH